MSIQFETQDNPTSRDEVEPCLISISSLYKHYSERYPISEFLENLLKCYNFNSERWAHLISLYNIKLDNNRQPKISHETYELLRSIKNGDNLGYDDEEQEVAIHFNASAYFYLRYLISHFEYYSYLTTLDDVNVENSPLVNLALKIHISKDKPPIYAFEDKIEKVLALVRDYKKNIDQSYLIKFIDLTPQQYIESVYTFGDEQFNKRFYITRVITTHITYLDDFRYYLFNSKQFDKFSRKLKGDKLLIKQKNEVNDYLIDQISTYLQILDEGIIDPNITSLLKNLKEKVILAKSASSLNKWSSISTTNIEDYS